MPCKAAPCSQCAISRCPEYRYSASSSNAVLCIRSDRAACTHKIAASTARLTHFRRLLDSLTRAGPCLPRGITSTRVLGSGSSSVSTGESAAAGTGWSAASASAFL